MRQLLSFARSGFSAGSVICASLLLSSCVSFGGGKAPPSLLVLSADATVADGAIKTGMREEAIVISAPETPLKLDNNRVAVQIDATNTAYIPEAVWADRPANLFRQLLAETLSAKTDLLVLSATDASGRQRSELSGQLLEFGVDARNLQAVIVYDAVRIQDGKPVERRRFEKRAPVAVVEPGPAAAALNEIANDVAAEVSAWIGGKAG